MKKQKKGFTLIELMVVMAIIAVLATLIIAAINTARKASRDTTRRSNIKSIQAGLEAWAAAHSGNYPKSCAGGAQASCTAAIEGLSGVKSDLSTYLSNDSTVTDPAGNNGRYCYFSSGNQQYVLRLASEAASASEPTDWTTTSPYCNSASASLENFDVN